jgi:Rrf2 family protein
MLSKKAKYAIRALIHLAQHQGTPILIKDIAEQERIPRKFLEAILLELKVKSLLQSKPGPGGGYLLRRPADSINLGEVIRLTDGHLAPIACASQTAYAPCEDCPDVPKCVIRSVMKQVRDATAKILEQTTLEQLVNEQGRLNSRLSEFDFNI